MAEKNENEGKAKNFRKRPNKSEIEKQAKLRGHFTCNEETMLKGLKVKNALQRIYTKTFDESLSKNDCLALQKAMDKFLAEVDAKIQNRITSKS